MHEQREREFAEFFAASWSRLFRTTWAVAGDRQLAEDALQSAFAKAYASWRRVSTADNPEAYVRKMAVNEVLGMRRRSWWRSERTGVDFLEPPGSPSPEAHVVGHDELWSAVLSLPRGQRAVLVLRYYEDLSERQIADVSRCSTGNVKSQASAALRSLRRLIPDGAGRPDQSEVR